MQTEILGKEFWGWGSKFEPHSKGYLSDGRGEACSCLVERQMQHPQETTAQRTKEVFLFDRTRGQCKKVVWDLGRAIAHPIVLEYCSISLCRFLENIDFLLIYRCCLEEVPVGRFLTYKVWMAPCLQLYVKHQSFRSWQLPITRWKVLSHPSQALCHGSLFIRTVSKVFPKPSSERRCIDNDDPSP